MGAKAIDTSIIADIENFVKKHGSTPTLAIETKSQVNNVGIHHSASCDVLRQIVAETTNDHPDLAADAESLISKMSKSVVTAEDMKVVLKAIAESMADRELESIHTLQLLLKFELLSVIEQVIQRSFNYNSAGDKIDTAINRISLPAVLEGTSLLYLDKDDQPVDIREDSGALKLALEFSSEGKTWLERDCDLEWHMDNDEDKEFRKKRDELLRLIPFKRNCSKDEKIRIFELVLDFQDLITERCRKASREPELFFSRYALQPDVKKRLESLVKLAEQTFGKYGAFLEAAKNVKKSRNWTAHANAYRSLTYDELRAKLDGDKIGLQMLELAKTVARDPELPLAEMRVRENYDVNVSEQRTQIVNRLFATWSNRFNV